MSFLSLYLLAVLSAAFQHSWSLFSWNLLYLISKSQSIWAFYFTGPPSGLPNLLPLLCTSASPQDLFSLHSPDDSIQVPGFMLRWFSNILSPSQIFFYFKFHLSSYDNKNSNLDFVLSLWYSFLISENGNFILSISQAKKLQHHPWLLCFSLFHIPSGSKSCWLYCQFISSVWPHSTTSIAIWPEPLLSPAWMTATTPKRFSHCSCATDSHHHRKRDPFIVHQITFLLGSKVLDGRDLASS